MGFLTLFYLVVQSLFGIQANPAGQVTLTQSQMQQVGAHMPIGAVSTTEITQAAIVIVDQNEL